MKIGLRLIFIAMTVMLVSSSIAPGKDGACLMPNICDLFTRPRAFQGKTVIIRGKVESDGIERTLLLDPRCPGKALTIKLPEKSDGNEAILQLDNEIFRGQPGTLDKQIYATFTGTFYWKPKQIPAWLLVVSSVSDIKVTPLKKQ